MDTHPTPFPATKTQSVRSRYKNVTEAPKSKPKDLIPRQKRVFGTIRNPNVPEKHNSLPEKTTKKQPVPRKQSKSVKDPEIKETLVTGIKPLEATQTLEIQSVQDEEIDVLQPESTQSTDIQSKEFSVIEPESSQSTDILSVQTEEIAVLQPESTQSIDIQSKEFSVIEPESSQSTDILSVQTEENSVIQPEKGHKTTEIPSIPVVEVSVIPTKDPKSTQETETTPVPPKKTPAENRVRTKKKSVCFPDLQASGRENASKKLQQTDGLPRTPVRSPFALAKPRISGTPYSLAKPRLSGTPYQSAEKCSHCRFDRLETSSYWLSQIRLAESVGKHFISLAFFGLALDSKAEPYRNLRVELKKYLGRHEYLSAETEWKDVSRKYGLLKDESSEATVVDDANGDIRNHIEQND